MQSAPRWLRWAMAPVPAVVILYLLEGLIQYNWLGRNWPIGRMWWNLIIVSLVIIAGIVVVIRNVRHLLFRAHHLNDEEVGAVVFWVAFLVLGCAVAPALNALCSNPAINWSIGPKWAFGGGVTILALGYYRWYSRLKLKR